MYPLRARARTLCLVLFVSLAFGLGSGAFAVSRWNHKRRTLVLSARSFARRYLRLRLIADIGSYWRSLWHERMRMHARYLLIDDGWPEDTAHHGKG